MAIIACAYLALPKRYHPKPDWEETAVYVVTPLVFVIVGFRSLWRDIAFWMAVIFGSVIQLAVVHAWVHRVGELGRGAEKSAALLGFVLFVAIYRCIRLLRRKFGEETLEGQ